MSKSVYNVELPLMKSKVHPAHPFNKASSHEFLLQYLRERLLAGKQVRDSDLLRYVSIDKHVSGWMRMSEVDRKRAIKEETKGQAQAVTINLPLTFVHIDDMMTYYAQTFAPNRGMFYSTGKPDEQSAADQIVTLMNNHAIYSGYFRHTLMSLYNTLKYNLGGLFCAWSEDTGPKIGRDQQGTVTNTPEVVWSGNRVESLDMYNTFYDPFIHPTKIHLDGEWAARAKLISRFQLLQKANQGLYYNVERALELESPPQTQYYRHPPAEAQMNQDESKAGGTDWISVLSMSEGYAQISGFELVEVFIRVNPYQLNLVPRNAANKQAHNQLELYRVTLLNDMHIIDVTPMNNVHGHIPFYFGSLNDDLMEKSQKSVAEILKPLQSFASFLMNTHILATRKNIWGLTVYDPSVMDLSTIPEGEVSARVATKPLAAGKKIQDYIYEHNSTLETKQTMQDLESVFGIINQFFPTQSLPSQIAGIDRAVDSQVAAVQNGANRRMQKGARLLDDLLFRPLRFCMYFNIVQFQKDGIVADFYGKKVNINLDQLKQTDLPFILGQGLKAIDRMGVASHMQELTFAMIQAPQAGQQFDLAKMINYWGNLVDIDIDMTQFRIQQPQNLNPDGTPATTAPGAGGEAAAISPATAPSSITAPIYGG